MAVSEVFAPTGGMISGSIGGLLKYWWVFAIIIVLMFIGGAFWIWRMVRKKKTQWTHKLIVQRVLPTGYLSLPIIHLMRRFPLIKKAEVFELEKPFLGGYLIPELDKYSGENEFKIILDTNNRIYTNLGEIFNPDKKSVLVSAKHSEIDIQRANLKADFQNINAVSKRIEWMTIAKYALIFIAIIAGTILGLSGMTKWGEAQQAKADSDMAQAQAMANLADAMVTIQSVVNTQQLMIPKLKELLGTNNLQGLIQSNQYINGTIQ